MIHKKVRLPNCRRQSWYVRSAYESAGPLRRTGGAARGAAGDRALLDLEPTAGGDRRAEQVLARRRQ